MKTFSSSLCLNLAFLTLLAVSGTEATRAQTLYSFMTPNTSLLKGGSSGNWYDVTTSTTTSPSDGPNAGTIGEIAQPGSTGPVGWNTHTATADTFGTIDLISGTTSATNLVIGDYASQGTPAAVAITLEGATLNGVANTAIANSSGSTVLFQNDVAPSGDVLSENGLTTYILGYSTNVIQSNAAGNNIIINNAIHGSGAALAYYGGGTSTVAGSTLELGAGSSNDVIGGNSPNASFSSYGGSFTSTATVANSDANTFSGGLTVGGTTSGQYGTVQIDGANALPTTGTVTVNSGSQLLLNNIVTTAVTYGGSGQSLVLNGTGTGTANNGALSVSASNSTTWQGTTTLSTNSSINVQGSSSLTLSGAVSGGGQLQTVGTGTLNLTQANSYSGGTLISSGTVVVGNATALGNGGVSISGGTLSIGSSGTVPSLTLALNQSFSMSSGTLSLFSGAGSLGSISGSGTGTFAITGGTLNLNSSLSGAQYSSTYNILSGFSSGSVSGLSITGYDSTDYSASLSTGGVLSFTAVSTPEPNLYLLLLLGFAVIGGARWLRREKSHAASAL